MSLSLKGMVGSRIYYTSVGTALSSGATFTELSNLEIVSGGSINNLYKEYKPFNSGIVSKVVLARSYEPITIDTAKVLSSSPSAYESSAARVMNDLAKNKTEIDLIKCIPITSSSYECTIYSGFFSESNLDDVNADELSKGKYKFEVFDMKEATGAISSGGVLTLTARS